MVSASFEKRVAFCFCSEVLTWGCNRSKLVLRQLPLFTVFQSIPLYVVCYEVAF